MKWWRTYLGLFIAETLALFLLNLAVGSAASEQVFLNLSANRLILVAIVLALILLGGWLLLQTFRREKEVIDLLNNPSRIFLLVVISFLALVIDLLLFSLNVKSLGVYAQIYLKFKPFLVWGFVVSLQTWLFAITWFGHLFIGRNRDADAHQYADELMFVLGIFSLVVVVKMLLVIPSAYGPVIRGDELRYFQMTHSLYDGNFTIGNINHSPYLYPLMLSVAFSFGAHTYDVIKILNVLYSSSIVFPLFLIARKYFSKKNALLVTLVASVLPYHLLFPRLVMSENLFFPLLMWVIFFVLHQPSNKRLALPWELKTGIAIGLLYMTRYITLAIIPFLLLAWWLIYPDEERSFIHPSRQKLLAALVLCVGVVAGYSPWLFSGLHAGVPLRTLLGFGITAETTARQLTLGNLMVWLVIYLAYFVLMVSPVLPLFFAYPLTTFRKWKKATRDWYVLTGALLVGFLAACVRHSWRAIYNGQVPTRIMGRYILYFTPLFIIAALLALQEGRRDRPVSHSRHILQTFVLPFGMVVLAYGVLIKDIFHLHDGNLINILGSVDGAYIGYLGTFYFVILVFIYGMISYLIDQKKLKDLMTLTLVALLVFFLAGTPAYYQDLMSYQEYQYIASKLVEMHRSPEQKVGSSIRVITPPGTTEWDRALLSNTLDFYTLTDLYVASVENFTLITTISHSADIQDIFIIRLKDESELLRFPQGEPVHFAGNYYVILY
ncbi:MAG: hypothetical protein PWQ55_2489 [Chloroflexota bacterium]|nr:hypothetical protein [Chloroflexota bacterium]